MTRISFVNGEYVKHEDANVHIEDRGYVFSDGVYEVALYKNGVLIDWDDHCERLERSLGGLKIDYYVSKSGFADIVNELISQNSLSDAVIYLQITRGVAPRLHEFPNPEVEPMVTMTVSSYKPLPKELLESGAKAITRPDLRWKLRNYKTISLLPNTLAKQEAVEAGAAEAILYEECGKVTEGSATNVFIVDSDGCLFTHPANESILGGITRAGVLKVAQENEIMLKEEPFDVGSLKDAAEVFITSTTKHILPITQIDRKDISEGNVGVVTKQLIKLYKEYIDKQ